MTLIRKYIREILSENITLCPAPKAVFMAGGPGSGKSTVINRLGLRQALQVVNADDAFEASLESAGIPLDRSSIVDQYRPIKKMYQQAVKDDDTDLVAKLQPEYLALKAILSKSMKLFVMARSAAKKAQSEYACDRQSFLIDGTAGDFRHISKQVKELRDVGYNVAMLYIDVPLQVSMERNILRGKEGGRRLHDDTVIKSWKAVDKSKAAYADIFGGNFFLIDGSEGNFEMSIDTVKPVMNTFLRQG
jgi:predicted ABC-type ATPase